MAKAPVVKETSFANQNRALALFGLQCDDPDKIIAALNLGQPRAVIALNGGTADIEPDVEGRLNLLIEGALAHVISEKQITTITGGTDAGVFAMLGRGLARHGRTAPCVGVAVESLADWPGRASDEAHEEQNKNDRAMLESNHSHFVLVEGKQWGDETQVMFELIAALSQHAPSIAVVASGGDVTRKEVLNHIEQKRKVIIIEGSGRFADEVAAIYRVQEQTEDASLNEIACSEQVEFFDVNQSPAALKKLIEKLIEQQLAIPRRRRGPTKLFAEFIRKPSFLRRLPYLRWKPKTCTEIVPEEAQRRFPQFKDDFTALRQHLMPQFAERENDALKAQNQFRMEQLLLLFGSALATTLGALQAALTTAVWPGIAEAMLAGGLTFIARRARELKAQERYSDSRLKAEMLRGEYFLFLGRLGPYDNNPEPVSTLIRQVNLIDIEKKNG